MSILILAVIACWIGEWSKLIQKLAWWTRLGFINVIGCAKCWGFWLGTFVNLERTEYPFIYMVGFGILTSATAMVLNKIYMRL